MKKESANPNFVEMEHEVLKFWKDSNMFQNLVEKNKNGPVYRTLDGPITANNAMGIHHVWGRTLKDTYIKFKAMNGFSQHFRNGFDAHGLPVEVEVEKEIGTKNKHDIMEYGMDNFVEKCIDRVNRFSGLITEQSIRFGQIMDWENSYYTNSDENITSIWHFLKKVSDNGWLVKANKPMQWCPRCGTSLSAHEMHGSYRDVEHVAVFFKAPVKDKNISMLVWTTTPWTLTSNVAIAVNPENDYLEVKVKSDTRNIIVGKEALKVLKNDVVEVVRTFKGKELVGLTYETCFPDLPVQNFEHKIVEWSDVSAEDGSGAVHIAPGCGVEDFELGKKLGLPEISPIDENGIIISGFGKFEGYNTESVADVVFEELKNSGKMLYTHTFKHSYPICWRCKTNIVFRLVESWFIKVDEIRPKLIEEVKRVKWEPEYLEKRMLDWLNNMGDWNISRSRYYGVPLPVYVTEKGEVIVVGSKEELRELAVDKDLVDNLPHLHRPYIDEIKIKSPKTGDIATRIPEVGDTWIDAGITPFSTNKYFTDKEYWEKNFPAEVVIEMYEQIRLWFYSLLLMSVVLTGKAPYDKVIGYESMVQEDGSKFSKSGFSIKAYDFAEKMGADTGRFMFAANPIANTIRFSYNLAEEAKRKLLGFWNNYTFFNTYAVIDNPDIANFNPKQEMLNPSDKWLIEAINRFVVKSKENYNEHKTYNIVADFEKLIDDLSNFYIRSNRRRFWKGENNDDKLTAYWCLYHALKSIILVMAPILPFMTERIWQSMVREVETNAPTSIFLNNFAEKISDEDYSEYLNYVEVVKSVTTLAGRLRNENQLKVKQPLGKMYVVAHNEEAFTAVSIFEESLKDELNIKEIINTTDGEQFNDFYLTVNFKTAGAVLKSDVQKLKTALENLNEEEISVSVNEFENGEVFVKGFNKLDSSLFVKNSKPKKELVLASDADLTVVLDTTLTEELINEGLLREFIRNIQVLRKEADFKIESRVLINVKTNNTELLEMLTKNSDKIKSEILAEKFNETTFVADIEKNVTVGEEEVLVSLKSL